jgi:DNA (cytosine-5)-methyltransferase 1
LVGWSEIDKYAIQAHNALFPQWADRNYGDISKIDWNEVPDFDLFTYSSPCQDFSNAGLQKGGDEGSGTRSSLLWECRRAIIAKRPKYLLLENVAALVSQKFLPLFNKWQAELASYGYSNFAQVLNAKDYGVPQNRERVFLVSILGGGSYHFPKPFKLDKRLKDVLEEKVDEKYYLSDKTVASFAEHCERKQAEGCGFKFEPTDGGGYAKSITTNSGSRETDNYIQCEDKRESEQ